MTPPLNGKGISQSSRALGPLKYSAVCLHPKERPGAMILDGDLIIGTFPRGQRWTTRRSLELLDPDDEEAVGGPADGEADAIAGLGPGLVQQGLRFHVEGHQFHGAHREGRDGLVADQDGGFPCPRLEDGDEPVNPPLRIDRAVGPPDAEGEAQQKDDEEDDDLPARN